MENIKKNIESNEIVWSSIKLQLKDVYGEAEYSNWLKLLTFSKIDKEIIIFYAPTKFMCDWILSHYGKKILSMWREKKATKHEGRTESIQVHFSCSPLRDSH